MNRRGFFRSLVLLAGAASVSPTIFIPKFEPVRWKVTPAIQRCSFEQFLIEMTPGFDQYILAEYFGKWRWRMDTLV